MNKPIIEGLNYDSSHMTDAEVIEEAVTLVGILTDPKHKAPGIHHVARMILPRLQKLANNINTPDGTCLRISRELENYYKSCRSSSLTRNDMKEVLGCIDDYMRANGMQVPFHKL